VAVTNFTPLNFFVACSAPIINPLPTPCIEGVAFYKKKIGEIKPQDFSSSVKRIEFFNPIRQRHEQFDPQILANLIECGLNDRKLVALCQASSNFEYLYKSVNHLVQDVLAHAARMYENQLEGVWRIIEILANKELSATLHSEKDVEIGKKSTRSQPSVAMILEGGGRRDLDLLRTTIPRMVTLGTLLESHDIVKIKHVDTFAKMCDTISREALKNLQYLMITSHGSQSSLGINSDFHDRNVNLGIWSHLRKCVQKLPSTSVVVLHACSSGVGKESGWNMANAFASAVPPGVQVFAPEGILSFVTLSKEAQFSSPVLKYWTIEGYIKEEPLQSYHVTAGDKARHCLSDKISYLSFCNSRPLLKAKQGGDHFSYSRKFYSKYYNKWQKIGEKSWNFLVSKNFSNAHLETISNSKWRLGEFCEYAASKHPRLGPKKLIKMLILNKDHRVDL